MNLVDFISEFPDEASCKDRWKAYRDKVGVICPKCGCREHYWKSDKESYECKQCQYRQSLRANTVMHRSQLPFRYWFITMHLLTSTKKSFSAKELQRQLGHNNYNPIWAMLHKLRMAMGKRDARYELKGMIELDEGFFSTETKVGEKGKKVKRGRGSQKKTKVLVMAESEPVDDQKKKRYKKPRKVNHIKMFAIDDLKAATIDPIVSENVAEESTVNTDNSTSYTNFDKLVKAHRPKVIPKEKVGELLPWVHIAISNAKRLLLDIYHDLKPEYLQSYLNEFCYKFNRRYFGNDLFDRLLIAGVSYKNEFRYNVK